ncbi:MAG: hypothetical protein AAFP82_13425 [Bacteroidota bacterium]
MNKKIYLSKKIVQDFILWTLPKINIQSQFEHSYYDLRSKSIWKCNSIFNAFENYKWKFTCSIPELGKVKGSSYNESQLVLEQIKNNLSRAVEEKDHKKALEYSASILEWGGVKRSNYDKLKAMDKEIINYYKTMRIQIHPNSANTDSDFSNVFMNSGFTKIYSLLIDDFIIYDSRVGATLCLLIREFLTEFNIQNIPTELNFAYGNARQTPNSSLPINRRNPSNLSYKFSVLRNNAKHHTINNMKANWLIKELAVKSKFKNTASPMRSLEAALFMIGYSVNG